MRKKRLGKEGEVPVPAYAAMQADGKLGSRMLEILLRGVSTRQYQAVLPEMADTVGVAKSSVSAEAIEASEEELQKLSIVPRCNLALALLEDDFLRRLLNEVRMHLFDLTKTTGPNPKADSLFHINLMA